MWELDHKEGCMLKNWCFQTVVLEKTLESPLDSRTSNRSILKEIKPEYSLEELTLKLIFIGYLMRRANSLANPDIHWPPDVKSWLIGKNPDAGKDWRQEEKGSREDKMVGWHHQPVDMNLDKLQEMAKLREAWRAAVHGVAELDMSERLNWTDWVTRSEEYISTCFLMQEIMWKRRQQTMIKDIKHVRCTRCLLFLPLATSWIGNIVACVFLSYFSFSCHLPFTYL